MQITVIQKMKYSGSMVYILQFEYVFMYLVSYQGEIIMDRVNAKPSWWKKVLWRAGFIASPYSQETMEACKEIAMSGAMESIDALIEKQKRPNGKKYTTAKEKPIPTNK
jgi:hypothetical protein